jgi:hypothetical protein
MTNQNKVSFYDMVEFVDQKMRFDITNQLITMTPLHAMCTLAACVASVTSMTTHVVPLAHHNIDEMSSFAKELVRMIIEEMEKKEGLDFDKVTKH